MKTNTDLFSNLYYKPRGQNSRVRALLNGSQLPEEISDLLRTAFDHYWKNDDEVAAFYLVELCEAVQRHVGEKDK